MTVGRAPVRLGVLGCANIALRSFLPAVQTVEALSLVAIASRTREKAAAAATRFGCEPVEGYQALIERADIDAVYVPLPTGLQREWVMRALEAGKHVIAEKSLGMRLEDVQLMVDAARSRGLVLMEDFMYRHHSQHRRVFEWLRDGTIGALRLFRADFGFPPRPATDFRYDPNVGGGVVVDAAAYTIDAARWFLGDDLDVASSTLFLDPGTGVPLHGSAVLVNPMTGGTGQLGFGFDNCYRCRYELWGSKGHLSAERAFTPREFVSPVLELSIQGERRIFEMPADNHFAGIARAFGEQVLGGPSPEAFDGLLAQARLREELQQRARRFAA